MNCKNRTSYSNDGLRTVVETDQAETSILASATESACRRKRDNRGMMRARPNRTCRRNSNAANAMSKRRQSDFRIRKATRDDLSPIEAWLKSEWEANGRECGFYNNLDIIAKGQSRGDLSVVVRSRDEFPVGFYLGTKESMDIMEIRPEFRRQGLGRRLAKHGLGRIRKSGEFGVLIMCQPVESIQFWQAMGFRRVANPYGISQTIHAWFAFPARFEPIPDSSSVTVSVSVHRSRFSDIAPLTINTRGFYVGSDSLQLEDRVAAFAGDSGNAVIDVAIDGKLISHKKAKYSEELGVQYRGYFLRIDRLCPSAGRIETI